MPWLDEPGLERSDASRHECDCRSGGGNRSGWERRGLLQSPTVDIRLADQSSQRAQPVIAFNSNRTSSAEATVIERVARSVPGNLRTVETDGDFGYDETRTVPSLQLDRTGDQRDHRGAGTRDDGGDSGRAQLGDKPGGFRHGRRPVG